MSHIHQFTNFLESRNLLKINTVHMPLDKSVQLDADGNTVAMTPDIERGLQATRREYAGTTIAGLASAFESQVARARIGHEAISRHQNDVSNRPHDLMNEVRHTPGLQTASKIVAPVRAAPRNVQEKVVKPRLPGAGTSLSCQILQDPAACHPTDYEYLDRLMMMN